MQVTFHKIISGKERTSIKEFSLHSTDMGLISLPHMLPLAPPWVLWAKSQTAGCDLLENRKEKQNIL